MGYSGFIKFDDGHTVMGYLGFSNNIPVYRTGDDKYNALLHAGNTYINNGTITINGTSITPLTSHQSLANYVTLNTN
jgi:riboflavin synthase alpha subunit